MTTTATAAFTPTYQPYQADQSLSFSGTRVLRQAAIASLFIVLIAGYSASHPASYQTSTTSATTSSARPAAVKPPQTAQ